LYSYDDEENYTGQPTKQGAPNNINGALEEEAGLLEHRSRKRNKPENLFKGGVHPKTRRRLSSSTGAP